ncbi:techylectin-5A [Nephila pilipes]|uniref:Techylectin-5A n=1 Tax=Nephila pilipes TaxID=299642 RepID=A0A8X6UE39_NEPPI|nr:techylectin-5A [Nephila pilipes]
MNRSCILYTCVFSLFVSVVLCNRERKITEILESVKKIEEHILKEDRLREIADIIRIDANVEKLSTKLDRVLILLDNGAAPAIGRSDGSSSTGVIPRDLSNNIQIIQNKLQSIELTMGVLEEAMKKLDFDPVKVNEIERRTTQLKDDMNSKLRKMMNVLTALYELNKDMKSNVESRSENKEQSNTESGSNSNYAAEFLMENLDELERKMKEQFSILTSEIRSEITNLKVLQSNFGANCQPTAAENDEEEWFTPQDNARSNRNSNGQTGRSLGRPINSMDNLVESLSRSTREIREEIQQGIQGLDSKLQNLTAIAQSHPICDSIDTSESTVTARKAVMPFDRIPIQNLDENSRRGKSDSCTKTVQNVPNPKSCADLRKGGATCDGIYVVFPKGRRAVRVLCDMTTDGGGWTVLMRRGDFKEKMTSFNRNWLSYKNGFGDSEGEFWIGNDVMNFMTSEEQNILRIHMSAFDGDEINLDYSSFSVGNESTNFMLNLGQPIDGSIPAANSLKYHDKHPFSTFDRKNDNFAQNCAATYKGGWWFNGCYFGFLTGEYFKPEDKRQNWEGILWYDWKGNAALKGAEMMIRPKIFEV